MSTTAIPSVGTTEKLVADYNHKFARFKNETFHLCYKEHEKALKKRLKNAHKGKRQNQKQRILMTTELVGARFIGAIV